MDKDKGMSYADIMRKLRQASIRTPATVNTSSIDELTTVDERVDKILGIINSKQRKPTNVLFFVMYDISSTRVRNLIVKYLIKKGCTRIQKSIFLADLDSVDYENIKKDLTEVQGAYENNDSILVVPISTEYLKSMRVIGQSIELDVIMHTKNVLFF